MSQMIYQISGFTEVEAKRAGARWVGILLLLLQIFLPGQSRAEVMSRKVTVAPHCYGPPSPRAVSVFLDFKGMCAQKEIAGDESRCTNRIKIWDDLYLWVHPATYAGMESAPGPVYFVFQLSRDLEGETFLRATNIHPHGRSAADTVFTTDFLTSDLSALFDPDSTGHLTGPAGHEYGAVRKVFFEEATLEIRILEFSISTDSTFRKPFFETLSCLVTVEGSEREENRVGDICRRGDKVDDKEGKVDDSNGREGRAHD